MKLAVVSRRTIASLPVGLYEKGPTVNLYSSGGTVAEVAKDQRVGDICRARDVDRLGTAQPLARKDARCRLDDGFATIDAGKAFLCHDFP